MTNPVPYKGHNQFLFVSYAHKNKEQALQIISRMQECRLRVWYDNNIHAGSKWSEKIANHVRTCTWFVALISREYLDSEYCKDELSYAKKKGRSLLLIYLEDVELPPAIDLDTHRWQAIHRSTYQTVQDLMDQLLEVEGIEQCQEPELPKPDQEEPAVPKAAEIATESELQAQKEPAENTPVEKTQNGSVLPEAELHAPELKHTHTEKASHKAAQKTRRIMYIAAVMVILALISIAAAIVNSHSNVSASSLAAPSDSPEASIPESSAESLNVQTSSQSAPSDSYEASIVESSAESVNVQTSSPDTLTTSVKNMIGEASAVSVNYRASLLWGSHVLNSDITTYVQNDSTYFQQLEMPNGDSYEMSLLPVQIVAAPDVPGYMLVSFADRFAVTYNFYCRYSLTENVLDIREGTPKNLDAALNSWGITEASPLTEERAYGFEIQAGSCVITHPIGGDSVTLCSEDEISDHTLTLSGRVSRFYMYQEIKALQMTVDTETGTCTVGPLLTLSDGGHTVGAVLDYFIPSDALMGLTWKTEQRPYNGRTEDFDVDGFANLYYYSTAPYGFVIITDSDIYYYQDEVDPVTD